MSLTITILIFILILLVLVVVHEFGHFIVAKKSGVRVDEFGVGFPPKVWGKKFGETEYTVNALPFGGFVKIYGEDALEKSQDPKDKGRKFGDIPLWKQALVMVAGVVMNFLLAWMLFSTAFVIGVPKAVSTVPEGITLENQALSVVRVLPNSPAAQAGLKEGDEILSLSFGGETFADPTGEKLSQLTAKSAGAPIMIRYSRGEEIGTLSVIPQNGVTEKVDDRAIIGVSVLTTGQYSPGFFRSIWEGLEQTYTFTKLTVVGLGNLVGNAAVGEADLDKVAGPVGIVNIVGEARDLGFVYLLQLIGIISLSLAVINIIPFPALDGGRLAMLLIESAKGSPIKPQIANAINGLGFALLILLMVFLTYNDIARIVSS